MILLCTEEKHHTIIVLIRQYIPTYNEYANKQYISREFDQARKSIILLIVIPMMMFSPTPSEQKDCSGVNIFLEGLPDLTENLQNKFFDDDNIESINSTL